MRMRHSLIRHKFWQIGPILILLGILWMPFYAHAQSGDIHTSRIHDAQITAAPDDMFIDIRVPAHQIYLGEPLRVQYDVYVASQRGQVFYNVEEPNFMKWYALEGATPAPSHVTLNGKSYTKEPFAVYFVTPTTLGKLPLPTLKAQIPFLPNKPWITHKSRLIEVIPPPSPAPEHFALGNIGDFKLKSHVSSTQTRVGNVITIELEIQAFTPVSGISIAPFILTSSAEAFKVYPFALETQEEKIVNDQFTSITTGHIQLLALKPGHWEIDPFKLVAFNPQKHQYQTHTTPPITIHVETGGETLVIEPPRAKTLRLDAWQTRPIQLQKPACKSNYFPILLTIPPVLLLLFLVIVHTWRRKTKRENADEKKKRIQILLESIKSAQTAQQQFDAIKEILDLQCQIQIGPTQSNNDKMIRCAFKEHEAQIISHALKELQLSSYSIHHPLDHRTAQQLSEILSHKV